MPRKIEVPEITDKKREAIAIAAKYQVFKKVTVQTGELFMSCVTAPHEGDDYWNQMSYLGTQRQEILEWCRYNCDGVFAFSEPIQPMRMTMPGESFDDLLRNQYQENRPAKLYMGFHDKEEMLLTALMFPEITVNVYWRSYIPFTYYFPRALIDDNQE